jgi:transposase
MRETLIMSYRETDRLKAMSRIEVHELTITEAAEALHLSERQLYRIFKRYRKEGEKGLIHRLRGRSSNVAYPKDDSSRALRLYRERYSDYGPTLFTERLDELHDIHVSRQTVCRWLVKAGLWTGSRKKRPHRRKRERRSCIGSLVQFDGSHHAWFEDRGPQCCLLVAIDDASGRVFARFASGEDTYHALAFWKAYSQRYGIPSEVYTDMDSVYYDHEKKQRLTQYGRALKALNVRCIYAHSPQAKGRVERANRTLQDRLLRALRERNISTIKEANRFLDEYFLDDFNRRFASTDSLADIHRSASGLDLTNIFCFEETRHVYHDWTIAWKSQFLQLLPSVVPLPPPRSEVVIRILLDSSFHVLWNDHELSFDPINQRPKPKKPKNLPQPLNHPWRQKPVGKLRSQWKPLVLDKSIWYDKRALLNCRVKKKMPVTPEGKQVTKNNITAGHPFTDSSP